ncbi:hypothetical protein G9F71_026240 [Clostridium sp. FP2]|nr:hypothetical protein [Clostridium sp. FP2]MBZ9626308.1 hypothetical protein [Clostridium sp. FP2]
MSEISKNILRDYINEQKFANPNGVELAFPTKPPLRHKMDIKRDFCLR